MSDFHILGPQSSGRVHLVAFIKGGAVALLTDDELAAAPRELASSWPGMLIRLDLVPLHASCSDHDCAGVGAPEALDVITGWECAAALAGQISYFLAKLPQNVQDQAAALTADLVGQMRAAGL